MVDFVDVGNREVCFHISSSVLLAQYRHGNDLVSVCCAMCLAACFAIDRPRQNCLDASVLQLCGTVQRCQMCPVKGKIKCAIGKHSHKSECQLGLLLITGSIDA